MVSKYVRRAAVIAELVVAIILLTGCNLGGSSSSMQQPATLEVPQTIYVFDANAGHWLPNTGRWYSYQQSDQGCSTGVGFPDGPLSPSSCFVWLTDIFGAKNDWITSQGPWWVDPNHQQLEGGTGFGLVHVIAFTQVPAALQGPANMDGTTVRLRTRISSDWVRPFAPSREGERPAHAYLWFQTTPRKIANCTPNASIGENCTRQSDYIYTNGWNADSVLDQSSLEKGHDFEIKMRGADDNKWTCLGAGRNVKYECMPFDQAVKQIGVMGVILAPVLPCPLPGPAGPGITCDQSVLRSSLTSYFNPGKFELRDFTVSIDQIFPSIATLSAWGTEVLDKPATKWNPMRFASGSILLAGGAMHFVIPKDSGALRLGVSLTTEAQTFEAAGPHIYISPAGNEPGQFEPSLYVGVAGETGATTRTLSVSRYREGDRVSIYVWKDMLLFAKNGEVIHMTPSPCKKNSASDCKHFIYSSTHLENTITPSIYIQ